jgi:hypothetical protein
MPYCCVPGCGNKSTDPRCLNLTFYRLPITNKDLLKLWIHNLNLNEEYLPDHYRVCSDHFDSNSFRQSTWASKRCILPGAAPIKFQFSHINQNETNPRNYFIKPNLQLQFANFNNCFDINNLYYNQNTKNTIDVLKTSSLENTERKFDII